jgi:hypothetical protein
MDNNFYKKLEKISIFDSKKDEKLTEIALNCVKDYHDMLIDEDFLELNKTWSDLSDKVVGVEDVK